MDNDSAIASAALVVAVGDFAPHLRFVGGRVTGMGVRAIACETGGQLSRARAAPRVDCVLLDLFLKGEDGLTLLTGIRGSHPDVPVIIMTGQGSVDAVVGAMRVGAYDFHCKPLDATRLQVAIR